MKHTNSLQMIVLLTVGILIQNSAIAQVETPEKQIDHIFAAWDKPDMPGAAIAVVKDGKIIFKKGYGSANLEYGIPNTPSTVFHIASVSKQVTAFAILLLEAEGKLSLEDDIRKYIPEMNDFGKVITLRQLALHNSGLRDQWTLLSMAGWRLDDVITKDQILKLVYRQRELNFNPGDGHMYSNTGYTLLAEVVARISGQSFSEFTLERIFKPLKMTNTQFYEDHERIVKNRAYSYKFVENGYKKSVLNYANAGATSLFTTVEDLSLWAMNFENPVVGNKELILEMNERGILNNGDTISYALGQDVGKYKGLSFISHGGADAGYRSFLGRFPDQKFSVIVFSNFGSFDPGGIALKVADIYLKDLYIPEKPVENEKIEASSFSGDPEILKKYTGEYVLQPGYEVKISLTGDQLFAETPELPKIQLHQISTSEFTVPEMGAKLSFTGDPDREISQLIVLLNGQRMIAPKKNVSNPVEINVTEYTGDFYSQELGTTYTFVMKDGKLTVTHIRMKDFELIPVTKDMFSSGQWFCNKIEFNRDTDNTIAGCRITSGRAGNVRFQKVR